MVRDWLKHALLDLLLQHNVLVEIREGVFQCAQLVDDASERPDVSLCPISLVRHSLRCLVLERPLLVDRGGLYFLVKLLAYTKVRQLSTPF